MYLSQILGHIRNNLLDQALNYLFIKVKHKLSIPILLPVSQLT